MFVGWEEEHRTPKSCVSLKVSFLDYTRVSVANEHRTGSRGAAPEDNYGFT